MAIPQYDELMNPTIQALHSLGGVANIRDIKNKVAEILNFSPEEKADIHKGATTKLEYRLAWVRTYLKRYGTIEKVNRGIWGFTVEGENVQFVDIADVKLKNRALTAELNQENEIENEDEIKEDLEDLILTEEKNQDVELEESSTEEIIRPFDPKMIDITSKTMILDSIIKRLTRNEINLYTEFQRQGDLWDLTKQSRLIESVLIRFPLPAFYFDGSQDSNWLVVDGLQRISSIKNFTIDKKLKLQNLEFLTQFNDYTYDDLPRDLQRRIEESEITVYVINPGTPNDVKYNIFKRINTGGLVLEPQEIRHALNQGTPARFIAELARMEEFKIATNYRIYPHRMMDREFVTRFVAFYINDYNDYKPDLDSFMNKSMADIKDLSEDERIDIKYNFRESMKLAKEIFTQWTFRKVYYTNERRKPINKALYEAWSVCLAKLSDNERDILRVHKDVLFSKFLSLMNSDTRFNDSITSSTSDKSRIVYRFTAIKNLIASTIN